jgi:hypothetical protein
MCALIANRLDVTTLRFLCLVSICSTQAESAIDHMDWIEKITGVIASLLCSQMLEQVRIMFVL